MAAPSTAYGTKKLTATKDSITYDTYLAKFLQNTTSTTGNDWGDGYFNSGDTNATKKSKILEIFKLSGFLRVTNTSEDLFVGYVNSGSSEASYHNSNRFGKMQLSDGVNNKILLNDGGLNTLAYAENGNNTNEPKWVNWINIAYIVTTAYYLNSTGFGYSYKIGSGSWVDVNSGLTFLSAKESITNKFKQINLSPSLVTGDIVYFKIWISNAEGTKTSAPFSITAGPSLAIPTGANKYSTPNGITTGTETLYMLSTTESALNSVSLSNEDTGLYLYKSEYFNTTTPSTGDIVDDG